MLRILVDSASSIKPEETEQYGVELLPVRIIMNDTEYLDGVDLDIDHFYEMLMEGKDFPKTSLPSLTNVQKVVDDYVAQGDRVLIITMSSKISGTYQTINNLFESYADVMVFDSQLAVGGVRFLVQEARELEDESFVVIEERLNALIKRVVIAAIPETLDYLLAGGRLSRTSWMMGKLLNISPVIGFKDGSVSVLAKKRGLKNGMAYILELLDTYGCDPKYGIVASYSYNRKNVEKLIDITDEKYSKLISAFDNMSPTIGGHWGPNAFGYIFVKAEE